MLAIAIVYFVIMPTIFVACFAWIAVDIQRIKRLEQGGHVCHAEIVKLGTSGHTRPKFYFITYRFEASVAGQKAIVLYTRKQSIGWKTYKHLKTAKEIIVKYDLGNPNFSRLSGQDADYSGRLLFLLIGLPIAIIWFGLLFQFVKAIYR
ncbi:MAG: hypothetical protein ABI947_12325 [Chloroflexota bacterium]